MKYSHLSNETQSNRANRNYSTELADQYVLGGGGGGIAMFVLKSWKNNRFQKELIEQDTNVFNLI